MVRGDPLLGGVVVIVLRRLGGSVFALNPDFIERVEATPDTVVTLTDDKKFLVEETVEVVCELITDYRAYIFVRAGDLQVVDQGGRPTLHVVPDEFVTSPDTALEAGVDLEFSSPGTAEPAEGIEAWLDEVDAYHGDPQEPGSGVSAITNESDSAGGGR